MSGEISEKVLLEAIDRIARTPDGRLQYLYLQRRLMAVSIHTDGCALNKSEGERTFASRLIGLMMTGIAESGGRSTSGSSTGGTEQPIVFAVPKPVDTRARTGAGSRITANTRVPGWDPPDGGD